jgi:hypothetical protein
MTHDFLSVELNGYGSTGPSITAPACFVGLQESTVDADGHVTVMSVMQLDAVTAAKMTEVQMSLQRLCDVVNFAWTETVAPQNVRQGLVPADAIRNHEPGLRFRQQFL